MRNVQHWSYLNRAVVRGLRNGMGYESGADVAAEVGIPPSTYWHYEQGTHRVPPDRLREIAKFLGVPQKQIVRPE